MRPFKHQHVTNHFMIIAGWFKLNHIWYGHLGRGGVSACTLASVAISSSDDQSTVIGVCTFEWKSS